MSDHPKCIDISHWQSFPDFEQVKAQGVIAMIHKCSEGTGYSDPNRRLNCSNAIKAGIAVATYHWLSPGSDPEAQMRFYLDELQPVPGERVVIDYEEEGCTLDQLKTAVGYLLADSRNLEITIYSGHLLKEQLGSEHDSFLADNTDLWLAQYTTGEPSWPDGTYPEWTLWQYSESGNVDGIEGGAVDLNRFNGSDDELLAWISPAGEPLPVPPDVATLTGKVSWFGGPDDTAGVSPDEGLAFISDVMQQPELFLPYQPEGSTGLARRLNPRIHYLAMRWNYDEISKEELLSLVALVRNPRTGFALTAMPADWGPGIEDRIADLSPGLMDDLGLVTDDEAEITFPYKEV